MDIVELALWGGERHNEDGWKILSSLCWEDRTPVSDTDTCSIFLTFGKRYLRVPGATKAVAHKIVPKKRSSYGLDFYS